VQALRAAGKTGGDGLDLALLAFGTDLTVFAGTAGNDSLQGNKADNLFYGGTGDDTLVGAEGADEYDFNRGDGKDVILDVGTPGTASKGDVLQFGAGITPAGLTLTRGTGTGVDDLIIDLGAGDRVTLRYYFLAAAPGRHLDLAAAQIANLPK
jgi:Ca2+-binding RTX toxin-like protein